MSPLLPRVLQQLLDLLDPPSYGSVYSWELKKWEPYPTLVLIDPYAVDYHEFEREFEGLERRERNAAKVRTVQDKESSQSPLHGL